jgi:hypothetical protein
MNQIVFTKEEIAEARRFHKYRWVQSAPGMPLQKVVDINWILAMRGFDRDQLKEPVKCEKEMPSSQVDRAKRLATELRAIEELPQVMTKHIISLICWFHGIEREELMEQCREHHVAVARQHAMYEIRRICQLSTVQMGKVFERDYSTVNSAIKKWPSKARQLGLECLPIPNLDPEEIKLIRLSWSAGHEHIDFLRAVRRGDVKGCKTSREETVRQGCRKAGLAVYLRQGQRWHLTQRGIDKLAIIDGED